MNSFKVWCHNNKEWEKDECFLAENGRLYQMKREKLYPMRPDTHTLCKFTGQKDINGRGIYENLKWISKKSPHVLRVEMN